jgi:hypothetical protein
MTGLSREARKFWRKHGINMNNVVFTNRFQNQADPGMAGITQDYEKFHAQSSVESAAWMGKITELMKEPTSSLDICWVKPSDFPGVVIVMEG